MLKFLHGLLLQLDSTNQTVEPAVGKPITEIESFLRQPSFLRKSPSKDLKKEMEKLIIEKFPVENYVFVSIY